MLVPRTCRAPVPARAGTRGPGYCLGTAAALRKPDLIDGKKQHIGVAGFAGGSNRGRREETRAVLERTARREAVFKACKKYGPVLLPAACAAETHDQAHNAVGRTYCVRKLRRHAVSSEPPGTSVCMGE